MQIPLVFLKERDILNGWLQDSSCDGCLFNFPSEVNFEVILFAYHVKKPAKIPKIKTRKIFVPHGSFKPFVSVQA